MKHPNDRSVKSHSGLIKAYNNYEFLNSPAARELRILSEMTEPAHRLRRARIFNTVVFFGSARTLPRQTAQKNLKAAEARIERSSRQTGKMKKELAQALNDLEMSRYYEDAVSLAGKLTQWFDLPPHRKHQFVICSGGGPGIMEAANKGAKLAKGKSIGLNISLPMEQYPNKYQDKDLSFEFHYFFIRKFWFFYLAKGLVIFPGGFGTLDEFFELVTLIQTKKTRKTMPVVLYGKEYWDEVINFKAMARWGMISKGDLKLFKTLSNVDETFEYLKKELTRTYFNQWKN
jgi:uncharacterized protein (TIGR00730 family)